MVRGSLTVLGLVLLVAGAAFADQGPERHFYSQGHYIRPLTVEEKPVIERVVLSSRAGHDSSDKIERRGILVRYPSAQATVVISHGFMCDKYDVGFIRQIFPKGKFNFLSYDFRAHGEEAQGQFCTFGRDEALDVQAAADFIKSRSDLNKLPVFGYGFSMGAVASIEAQSRNPNLFSAMILDCPFDSSENVIKKALESLKFSVFGYEFDMPGRSLLERYVFHPYVQEVVKFVLKSIAHMDARNIQTYIHRFSPAESIKKVEVPCLFIHCKLDKRVSVDSIKTIYEGARGPKMLWVTNGRGHYDSIFYNPEKYSKRVNKFLDLVMKGEAAKMPARVVEDDDENAAIKKKEA